MSIGRCILPSRRRRARPRGHRATIRAIVSALLILASAGAGRAEDDPVTWAHYDAPPFMIAGGPDRGEGIFDRIRSLLDDRLYGTPSRTLQAPFPRVVASLKDGAKLCFVGGVKTPEREAFAVFSLPVAMFYPLRLIVHATQSPRFEARAPLSLAAILADRSLRTSVLRNRSLGSRVDALMREVPTPYIHSEFAEAFRMLLAGRIDYLLEYSAIATYAAKTMEQDGAIGVLPFTETIAPVLNRVMCPNTDWGRQLVARIDAILWVERRTPAYRSIVEAWAEPGDLATIRDAYAHAFLDSE